MVQLENARQRLIGGFRRAPAREALGHRVKDLDAPLAIGSHHPVRNGPQGDGQALLFIRQSRLEPAPLGNLLLQFAGAFAHAPLQAVVRLLQCGVAGLDLGQHIVEPFDQRPHFVVAAAGGAQGIVLVLGYPPGGAGEIEDGLRHHALQV